MIAQLVSIYLLPRAEITLYRVQFQTSTPLRGSNQELFGSISPTKNVRKVERNWGPK